MGIVVAGRIPFDQRLCFDLWLKASEEETEAKTEKGEKGDEETNLSPSSSSSSSSSSSLPSSLRHPRYRVSILDAAEGNGGRPLSGPCAAFVVPQVRLSFYKYTHLFIYTSTTHLCIYTSINPVNLVLSSSRQILYFTCFTH